MIEPVTCLNDNNTAKKLNIVTWIRGGRPQRICMVSCNIILLNQSTNTQGGSPVTFNAGQASQRQGTLTST